MTPLGTVLVRGAGSIGVRHARVLAESGRTRVAVFPIRGGERPELALDGILLIETASDVPAALDGVIVATDTIRHVADALEFADRCPVLVEKPVATDALEGQRLRSATRDSRVFVAYCMRFDRGLTAMRQLFPDIGRIRHVRIECQSYLPDWRPGRDYRSSYSARAREGGVFA